VGYLAVPSEAPRFRPSRYRGQNFLVDRAIQQRIADAAQLPPSATVVEIGAGTGNLTEHLLARAARVLAVEIEPALVALLKERFGPRDGLTLLRADARELNFDALVGGAFHVVANLPYSIGTRLVVDLLQRPRPPLSLTILLQREVADRMVARPGAMALLSVLVQSLAAVDVLFRVPATAFRPRPEVESALLRLVPYALDDAARAIVRRRIAIARHGFAQPRKMMRNSLAAGLQREPPAIDAAFAAAGLDPRWRPGELALEAWDRVARAMDGWTPDAAARART